MGIHWQAALVALVVVPSVAGASSVNVGNVGGVQPAQADVCGDVVSQAICLTYTLVFGPGGVVPFTETEASWAAQTADNIVGGG